MLDWLSRFSLRRIITSNRFIPELDGFRLITLDVFRTFDFDLVVGGWYSRRSEASEARVMEPTIDAAPDPGSGTKPALGPVVQIDEGRIQAHLDEVVRSTVEETLNAHIPGSASRRRGLDKRNGAIRFFARLTVD